MASATVPTAMAGPQVNLDTPISLRVQVAGATRKFKLPLGDLNAQVLPGKLRALLEIPEGQAVTFERFSDSAGSYVTLDPNNTHVYKTLFRAAKAKLKLRLRAIFPGVPPFQPITIPGAFAAAFPEFNRFNGSEVTLNTVTSESTRTNGSTETLVPVAPVEPKADPATQQKRISTRLNRESFFNEIANISKQRELALRVKELPASATAMCSWSVFCNACDKPMADAHYHCNVCDDGDYDLCEACVNSGVHCPGDDHWLVKRHVQNGQVVNSTTERLSPKLATREPVEKVMLPEMPGAFTEEKTIKEEIEQVLYEATRTCNCCVKEDREDRFVTCINCPDYDLCIPCHEANIHGHHPAHKFKAVGEDVSLSPLAEFLCAPGRNTKHAALCDGCDKPIFGVRHKCLNCPDWDYCSECVKNSSFIHPGHRFAPLYEPISAPRYRKVRHIGIYCDGPLCENKHDYIEGTRYKCAICHDTDFCANCEAYPHNKHNHTHPLIQFKTPVRNATITTVHEDQYGRNLAPKGDRNAPKAESVKAPNNAAIQVQTIIDVKPAEASTYKPSKEKIEIKDLLAEPIQEKIKVQDLLSSPIQEAKRPIDIKDLTATFVRETIPDGTIMSPDHIFTQVWTLRNAGAAAWPAGCSVRYTGGDNMLSADVTESNIVDRVVEVGEEISFRVTLKAPAVAGTKISYWRLKTIDGQAFGHRLWCHVNVEAVSEPEVAFTQPSAPTELPIRQPGQWRDNFLQQALQHRVERAAAIEKQRIEFEKIKARQEAKQAAESQAKTKRAEMLHRLSTEISAARAAIDAARAAKTPVTAPQPVSELAAPIVSPIQPIRSIPAPQHIIDAQRAANEAQRAAKARELEARQARFEETLKQAASTRAPVSQEDYQMQLMLLEQQNRKRLLMARDNAPVEVEAEVRPVTVEDVVDEEDTKAVETQKSNMIFPKLDKESPVSSTADVSAGAGSVPSTPGAKSDKSELEIFEDAESVSFVDESDEEAGFLTDEEYDILDASDEELAA